MVVVVVVVVVLVVVVVVMVMVVVVRKDMVYHRNCLQFVDVPMASVLFSTPAPPPTTPIPHTPM